MKPQKHETIVGKVFSPDHQALTTGKVHEMYPWAKFVIGIPGGYELFETQAQLNKWLSEL